jgi:hypothetical protein
VTKEEFFAYCAKYCVYIIYKTEKGCKAKAIPLQAWTCPYVSRRLKLPGFKTIGTFRW